MAKVNILKLNEENDLAGVEFVVCGHRKNAMISAREEEYRRTSKEKCPNSKRGRYQFAKARRSHDVKRIVSTQDSIERRTQEEELIILSNSVFKKNIKRNDDSKNALFMINF